MTEQTNAPEAPKSSLMAELEGLDTPSGAKPATKLTDEHTHEQSPDPLDAANHELALTAEQKATKAKADMKAKGIKGYSVTVRGDYYAPLPGGKGREKMKKPYEISFNLASMDKALSIIVGRLLDKGMKKKYPDYESHRTCEIVKSEPLTEDTPESTNLKYMSEERLLRYIADHKVPVNSKAYLGRAGDPAEGLMALRRSVIDFVQNPEGFAAREERRMKDMATDAELAALNPDLE